MEVSMVEFRKDVQVASSACARCRSGRTVVGRILAEGQVRFLPRGLRWWKLSGGVAVVPESVQACLDCGFLGSDVDPAELRAMIERAGGDDLIEALR
jgi:hypothetical protein